MQHLIHILVTVKCKIQRWIVSPPSSLLAHIIPKKNRNDFYARQVAWVRSGAVLQNDSLWSVWNRPKMDTRRYIQYFAYFNCSADFYFDLESLFLILNYEKELGFFWFGSVLVNPSSKLRLRNDSNYNTIINLHNRRQAHYRSVDDSIGPGPVPMAPNDSNRLPIAKMVPRAQSATPLDWTIAN